MEVHTGKTKGKGYKKHGSPTLLGGPGGMKKQEAESWLCFKVF
jgi:hypothetical protein